MEHLENDLEVLKELHRVLSYHGVIVVTTPNKNFPFFWDPVNKILEIFFNKHIQKGFWAGIWTNHLRLYYPSEAEKILEEAGFEIINRESLTRLCLPFNKNLLYGGKLPRNISESFLNNIKKNKKPLIIILMLYIVNLIDKMNSNFTWKNIGVNVFIKAKKV
jgi:SAM-dependent methyltransferase